MKVTLKSITPDAEVNIVEIARVSSSRVDKAEKPEDLVNYLIKNLHWSPFEHSFLTFEIVTSKAIGIQLLRHRSFTFQEFSQRYSKVENMELIELRRASSTNRQSSTEVFDPVLKSLHPVYDDYFSYTGQSTSATAIIENHLEVVKSLYNSLLDAGVAKECARMILPMCSETTIFMTGSVRSWIHFLDIRLDGHAQKEIILIAREIKSIFRKELPLIAQAKWGSESTQTSS